MKKITINADDFGLNSSVNKAIIDCFDRGLINSTTLMANMPGFDEAIDLARKYNLTNKIGAHLVLTDGIPLTAEIKSISFLFRGKKIYSENKYRLFFPDTRIKQLIFNEFSAQIEKIQSQDIAITHIDTHHHVHEMLGISKILLLLTKKYNITHIRILNNLEKPTKFHKKIYRIIVNFYLNLHKANFSDFFGNQYDFMSAVKKDPTFLNKKIEVMVHPDYDVDGRLIDKAGINCDFSFLESLNNVTKKSSLSK